MGWKPIETAPTDGTRVILFDAEREPSTMICHKHKHSAGWWSDATPSGRSIVWQSATHWTNIPKPPKDS